jgi:hypothetical protein
VPKYVTRNSKGQVIAAYSNPQFARHAPLPDDDLGLLAYMSSTAQGRLLAEINLTIDDIRQAGVRPGLFVDRDADGNVVATHERPLRDGHELTPLDDPSLQRFLADETPPAPPPGFAFTYNSAHRWRVLRTSDNTVVSDNLETMAACADAADRLTNARARFQKE